MKAKAVAVKGNTEGSQYNLENVTFEKDDDWDLTMLVPMDPVWERFVRFMNEHSDIRVNHGSMNRFKIWINFSDEYCDSAKQIFEWFSHQNHYSRYAHLITAFSDALKKHNEDVEARKKEILDRGKIKFEEFRLLFTRGQKAVVRTEYGAPQGVIINNIRMVEFCGMMWWNIGYKAINLNNGKYVMEEDYVRVYAYNGQMNVNDLPVHPPLPEETKILAERAEKYQRLIREPHYMFYTDNMFRRTWFFLNKFRADGRVIIDEKSFVKFNPNYSQAHGPEVEDLNDEVLFTVPPVVRGYSMRLKMWGEMLIDKLGDIEFKEDAFKLLVMNEQKKDLIHALVSTQTTFTDLIGGKGGGTIFLLHGGPGTGKTLTAEAVSEILKRPLYMVSVGELGTTANELEEKLRDILELATIWNAILLIDEADIFLEERTTNNIERNAMVGIFLRLLEYYSGVLFLTTNRIKVIDHAFMSRVSLALHYDKLDEKARMQIWHVLLKAQGAELPETDLKALSIHNFNGRQIKNIIKMSLSLAQSRETKVTMEQLDMIIQHMNIEE